MISWKVCLCIIYSQSCVFCVQRFFTLNCISLSNLHCKLSRWRWFFSPLWLKSVLQLSLRKDHIEIVKEMISTDITISWHFLFHICFPHSITLLWSLVNSHANASSRYQSNFSLSVTQNLLKYIKSHNPEISHFIWWLFLFHLSYPKLSGAFVFL